MSPITGESFGETPQGPWDVVRWTKLRKITGQAFSEVGKRNFGHPTCMAVSTSIVIGTSKGIILVFDYQQSLKTIIGTGTKGMSLDFFFLVKSTRSDYRQLLNAAPSPRWHFRPITPQWPGAIPLVTYSHGSSRDLLDLSFTYPRYLRINSSFEPPMATYQECR